MSINIAILVSGRGSNMTAILEAVKQGHLDARVLLVASNNEDAPALETARSYGVPTFALSHRGMSRKEHESRFLAELNKLNLDYVVLAGYMRILTSSFLENFKSEKGYYRVINIHPSLLPAFPGASAYEDAYKHGVLISGITVHLVDEKVDHGPILAQETFRRLQEDTLDSFRARGLKVEHKLYPYCLQKIAEEGICILDDGSTDEEKPGGKRRQGVSIH